jgi:hypothetical protein
MEQGQLGFLSNSFKVPTCQGEEKLLSQFTTWELLNIRPYDVLNIPDRLYSDYSISPTFLQNALTPYIIQEIGKDNDLLENRFGRENINRIAYVTSATRHYSWPKGTGESTVNSHFTSVITLMVY